jgi:hypothetical protein
MMPAMADLLLRRAPAAPGEVYDVLSGSRIVGRILLSDASAASQWVWTLSYDYQEDRTPHSRLCRYPRRRPAGVREELEQGNLSRCRSRRRACRNEAPAYSHKSAPSISPAIATRPSANPLSSRVRMPLIDRGPKLMFAVRFTKGMRLSVMAITALSPGLWL